MGRILLHLGKGWSISQNIQQIGANFGLEIRLQIISQVDYNVYLKNIKILKKKRKFSDFVRKKRNSSFKRKSGISAYFGLLHIPGPFLSALVGHVLASPCYLSSRYLPSPTEACPVKKTTWRKARNLYTTFHMFIILFISCIIFLLNLASCLLLPKTQLLVCMFFFTIIIINMAMFWEYYSSPILVLGSLSKILQHKSFNWKWWRVDVKFLVGTIPEGQLIWKTVG